MYVGVMSARTSPPPGLHLRRLRFDHLLAQLDRRRQVVEQLADRRFLAIPSKLVIHAP